MPIPVTCQCGQRFAANDELAGKKLTCPTCKQPLLIPRANPQPAARPAPAARPQPAQTPGNRAANPVAVAGGSVVVQCRCGQRFKAAPHLFGKSLNCPACKSPIKIPFPAAPKPAAPAPIDPLAMDPLADPLAGFGSPTADNDPFGIGLANSAPALPQNSFPQPASFAMPTMAKPVSAKKKSSSGKGKSGKFWALTGSGIVTALVVMFLVMGVIGRVVRSARRLGFNFPSLNIGSQKVEWITHTSRTDGFTVDIVKQPPGVKVPYLAGQLGAGGVMSASSQQGPCTIVACQRVPTTLTEAQSALALNVWENTVSSTITSQKGKITSSRACTVGGLTGRQLNMEVVEGGTTTMVQVQAAFHGDRVFVLGFLATRATYQQSDADRFFTSFHLGGSTPSSPPPGGATSKVPPGPAPSRTDFATARKNFRTTLTQRVPAPQPPGMVEPIAAPPGTILVDYRSQDLSLKAIASAPRNDGMKRPGLLYLHGGFAFAAEDWDQARPFADAGYVVMIPILRGENSQPGSFSLFYDEVDDALAAAEALAQHPDVDARNLFVAGHSAGGTLAALAALASDKFRASAPYSGILDMRLIDGDPSFPVVFDTKNQEEWRMRSVLEFASYFKCPTRLFYGDQEEGYDVFTNQVAQQAKQKGLDVESVRVSGDHMTMVDAAIPQTLAFFAQHTVR
jgi:acetyl esterase/lipase